MEESQNNQSREEKSKSWLESIQNLPEGRRKMIFWFLIIIIALILLNIYFKKVGKTLEKGIEMPNVQLPEIELPEM